MSSHARVETAWPDPAAVRSVLAVKFGMLGDLLLADAALAALRERYPRARLRFLTDSPQFAVWLPPTAADEVLFLPLGAGHPTYRPLYDPRLWMKILRMRLGARDDVAVFLNDPASAYFLWIQRAVAWAHRAPVCSGLDPATVDVVGLHELDRGWRIAGGTGPAPLPRVPTGGGPFTVAVRRRRNETGARIVVALQPLTVKPAKQWPIECFVALARAIVETMNGLVVVVGSAAEARIAERFEFLGDRVLSAFGAAFDDLIGVLRASDAVVAHDSGPFHLAVAAGRPTVVLAGPGDPRYYRYGRPHARVLRRCVLAREDEECPRYLTCLDARCLPSLPVADVLDALGPLLEGEA
jgi:ADP-heptose:LPS heptosyltransferase